MHTRSMHSTVEEGVKGVAIAQELTARLKHFNERLVGPLNSRPVVLSIRDRDGHVIAGLSGDIFWNALLIDVLWVDEPHRRRGLDASLVRDADALAERNSCDAVYLSTFEFQAPEFYAAQGYHLIGELRGVPRGSKRQWFHKVLGNNAV